LAILQQTALSSGLFFGSLEKLTLE
jgi:hypothetical protein